MQLLIVSLFLSISLTHSAHLTRSCQCDDGLLGNNYCNTECNNQLCNWDGLDCTIEVNSKCHFASLGTFGCAVGTCKAPWYSTMQDVFIDCNSRLAGISILWTPEKYLTALQFIYNNDDDISITPWRGNHLQLTTGTEYEYFFESNEFVVQIEFYYGSVISYIRFETNLGRVIKHGSKPTNGTVQVPIPIGSYVLGFRFQAENNIEAFEFFSPADPKAFCPCGKDSLGDGICTDLCNTEVCEFDKGDCETPYDYSDISDSCRCEQSLLKNGYCNEECNNIECNFDKTDCLVESNEGCLFGKIGSLGLEVFNNDFNDAVELDLTCDWRISGINIYHSTYLYNIQFVYSYNGKIVQSPWRGTGATPSTFVSHTLDPGENITKISGTLSSSKIYRFVIETSNGRTFAYGSNSGDYQEIVVPDGFVIKAFGGGWSSQIDTLQAYAVFSPIQTAQCRCDSALLGNSVCNNECSTLECNYDGGDCIVSVSTGCDIAIVDENGTVNFTGTDFNDISDLGVQCNWKITAISLYHWSYIRGFGFTYWTGSQYVSTSLHSTESASNFTTYTLQGNEFITRFAGRRYGSAISYVLFETNLGRKIEQGSVQANHVPFETNIPQGSYLLGMSGKYYATNFVLKVHAPINPSQFCLCDESFIGDGICTQQCNTDACQNDGGDCNDLQSPLDYAPQCACDVSLLKNGYCNPECNNLNCMFDGTDCSIKISDGCHFLKQGEINSNAGKTAFEDYLDIQMGCDWKISAIEIYFNEGEYFGKYLSGLRTEYMDQNGQAYTTNVRGNNGLADNRFKRIELAPNEFVTRVSGYESTYIEMLIFETNLGRIERFGNGTSVNFDIKFTDGTHLTAFGGDQSDYVYQLKLYTNTGENDECQCLPSALSDDICTEECKIEACNNDAVDCAKEPKYSEEDLAYCTCKHDLVHNAYCNNECASQSCFFDGGDCISSTSSGCQLAKVYQFGQSWTIGASDFNDPFDLDISCAYRIKQIKAHVYSQLDGLQIIYDNQGTEVQANYHFNANPVYGTLYTFDLKSNEVITKLRIYEYIASYPYRYVKSLLFETNLGRSFLAGSQTSDPYIDVPIQTGSYLIGFSGTYSTYSIEGLGIYVLADPQSVCSCPVATLGDGYCNELCNIEACNFDEGDCANPVNLADVAPNCFCESKLYGNGECDEECNDVSCRWDGLDCAYSPDETCSFVKLISMGETQYVNTEYDDAKDLNLSCNARLSGLDLNFASTYLAGLRATYNDNGTTIVGPWHGSSSTSPSSYTFAADEYITKIKLGQQGVYIQGIYIKTTVQEINIWKAQGGQNKEIGGNGSYIITSIAGSLNSYPDKLEFQARVNSTDPDFNFCSCETALLGNGTCDNECNNIGCNWDGYDCGLESNNNCLFNEILEVGTAGTDSFNEVLDLNIDCNWRIKTLNFKINTEKCIVGIQVEYDNGGKTVIADKHEAPNAVYTGNYVSYKFQPNEFITEAQIGHAPGKCVLVLRFVTNLGQVIESGGSFWAPLTVKFPKGKYLAALSGEFSADYITKLTLYTLATPDNSCACGAKEIGDGICTQICNTASCNNEGGDCDLPVDKDSFAPYCSCDDSLLRNGRCNEECNTFQCQNDGLDCTLQSKSCQFGVAANIGHPQGTTEFSDFKTLDIGCDWKIKGLNLYWSTQLINFRVKYIDNFATTYNTPWRGSTTTPTTFDSYEFEFNEYITRVASDNSSTGIRNLLIETNLGRIIKYGNTEYIHYYYDFTMPKGKPVAAFGGNASTSNVFRLQLYINHSGSTANYELDPNAAKRTTIAEWKRSIFGYNGFTGYYSGRVAQQPTSIYHPNVPEGFGRYNPDGTFDMSSVNELLYCKCGLSNIGNGTCDTSCFSFECGYDGGDCGKFVIGCDCPVEKLGDGICDNKCNNLQCIYDNGDCKDYPDCECDKSWIGNGLCDIACFNQECGFDEDDCGAPVKGCECPVNWLGDGQCNELCNNEGCEFDRGDCKQLPNCKCDVSKIRNYECDVECFNRDCIYDGGDCGPVYKDCPCPRSMLLNGKCDRQCNLPGCFYDNGACLQ